MASNSGRMSVSVSSETQARLEAIATSLERSRSWIVNQAIEQYLELYEWQKHKIQARLERADSEKATFLTSKDVDAVIDTFAP